MSRHARRVFGGVLLALLSLVILASIFWTAPAAVSTLGVASSVPLLMLQGLAGALTATMAGRLMARSFPRSERRG